MNPSTPTVGLGQFIREHRFQVPSHQRDYSWSTEYVDQFADDVDRAYANQSDQYFFGLMVFTQIGSNGRLNVIDGQQRLATALMLIGAMRNWMESYTDFSSTAQQFSERYLGDTELGSEQIEPKLVLNDSNNAAFNRYVIQRVPVTDIKRADGASRRGDRSKRLLEAAVRLNERVVEQAQQFEEPQQAKDHFVSVVRYLTESAKVVALTVDSDEDAYTIFETLNDRGLALAPLDLVKNHLFSRAEASQQGGLREMEARWNEMMTILGRSKIEAFLRMYWASRYGLAEGPRLFSAFKTRFNSSATAESASIELRDAAEHYVAVRDANDPVWNDYEGSAVRIDNISVLGATQLHPVIMSAIGRFDQREMERLLRLIEVIAVRYQLVARGRPGRMESLGSRVARSIFAGTVTTATQALEVLRELYVDDTTFEADFRTKVERDKQKARYMLRVLELESRRRGNVAHPEETVPGQVTLEHIMPKTLTDAWRNSLGERASDAVDYVHRMGNLCLLGRANQRLGQVTFETKRSEYASSELRTTSRVAEFDAWGPAQIEERQQYLASLAVQAWRFQ